MRLSLGRLVSLAVVGGFLASVGAANANVRFVNPDEHPWVVAPAGYVFTLSGDSGRYDATCSFPNVCVEQGASATLGIQLNCTKGGKPVSCGTVTWSTKTSVKQLTASFKPNPSPGPNGKTVETVKSAKGQKPATYKQTISWKCTGITPCAGNSGPINIVVQL